MSLVTKLYRQCTQSMQWLMSPQAPALEGAVLELVRVCCLKRVVHFRVLGKAMFAKLCPPRVNNSSQTLKAIRYLLAKAVPN